MQPVFISINDRVAYDRDEWEQIKGVAHMKKGVKEPTDSQVHADSQLRDLGRVRWQDLTAKSS